MSDMKYKPRPLCARFCFFRFCPNVEFFKIISKKPRAGLHFTTMPDVKNHFASNLFAYDNFRDVATRTVTAIREYVRLYFS